MFAIDAGTRPDSAKTAYENLIDRKYSQQIGYWRDGLEGMDHLSDKDLGSTFKTYLGLSDAQMADAIERMIESGDDDLAARIAVQAIEVYPGSSRVIEAKRRAFSTLRQKYQQFDPFRFVI